MLLAVVVFSVTTTIALGTTVGEVCRNTSFTTTLEAVPEQEPHGGPVRNSDAIAAVIQGAHALEIGGPTPDPINIYSWLASCDNVAQYADPAHARPDLEDGAPFIVGERTLGRTIVWNADDLTLPTQYDLLYASHVLEHMQDPLGALLSWDKLIKPGGALFLILPWKNNTFDRYRSPTTLEHLAQIFVRRQVMADFEQTVRAIDITLDFGFPPGSTNNDLRRRTLSSPEGMEMLHWHVFDLSLLRELYNCLNYRIIAMDLLEPFHQVIVGVKEDLAEEPLR